MKYVYLLQSIDYPDETDVGVTDDLRSRFPAHNAGRSRHAAKYQPWQLVSYGTFPDECPSQRRRPDGTASDTMRWLMLS